MLDAWFPLIQPNLSYISINKDGICKWKCNIATFSAGFQAFLPECMCYFPTQHVPVQPFEFHQLLHIIHLKRLLTCTLRHRNVSYCEALMVAIAICFLLYTALESFLLLLSCLLWPLKTFVTPTASHTHQQYAGGMTYCFYHWYMQCHWPLTAVDIQQRQTYCEGT